MTDHPNNFPKLHNAAWPGVVGKDGGEGSDPPIPLDTMLDMTVRSRGRRTQVRWCRPVSVRATRVDRRNRQRTGSVGRKRQEPWLGHRQRRCTGLGRNRRRFGSRQHRSDRSLSDSGSQRLHDRSESCANWVCDPMASSESTAPAVSKNGLPIPEANQAKIADTFKAACDVAEEFDERLAAEGEICWGGMQSWRKMVDLLERVGHPERLGFQADMAHTLLYFLATTRRRMPSSPHDFDWDPPTKQRRFKKLTHALRPWTIDFHVAQNDATVHGTGSHDKTGRHCLPNDPNGKLDIATDAGHWLRDEHGDVLQTCRHICWDGCMFPNEVMHKPETWNDILGSHAVGSRRSRLVGVRLTPLAYWILTKILRGEFWRIPLRLAVQHKAIYQPKTQ